MDGEFLTDELWTRELCTGEMWKGELCIKLVDMNIEYMDRKLKIVNKIL